MARSPLLPARAAAGLGAALLVAAELAPLFAVTARGATVTTVRTGSHHGWALALLALVALVLTWLGTRPAWAALGAVALAALVVVLAVDLPDARARGVIEGFVSARAHPRAGLWLGLGGALVLGAAAAVGARAARRYQR